MKKILEYQDIVLKKLSKKIDEFYLAGGTALAKYYFQHRDLYDLDFFTQNYSTKQVEEAVNFLKKETGKAMKLINESKGERFVKMRIYELAVTHNDFLKIDFVEDVQPILKPFKEVDGIKVLSLDDIYLRKIFAVSGALVSSDEVGRRQIVGGRQEVKDLYDLYILSITYSNLSIFASNKCEALQKEGLIQWSHSYNRMEMKTELMELKTANAIDFGSIERHFKKEIENLIQQMV